MTTDDYDEDQYEFDFDETVLGHIDEVEAQWTASQAPRQAAPHASAPNAVAESSKQRAGFPPHANGHGVSNPHNKPVPHSVSGMAPAPFGRTKAGKPRDPAPLNTTPGVTGTGFGWEHGGKRSMEGNLQRNLDAIDARQAHWYGSSQQPAQGGDPSRLQSTAGGYAPGQNGHAHQGHSRGGSRPIMPIEEESEILDSHNASDSLHRMPAPVPAPTGRNVRAVSEEAKAKRWAAIMGTAAASSSTTTTTAPTSMAAPRPAPMTNRSFSRSASTGSSILTRPQPMAGPSRLSPIPDMPSSHSSSQHSSGAMLRRTHMELEETKKREQALVRELAQLKAQAEQHRSDPVPAPTQGQNRQQADEQDSSMPSATQAAWTTNLPADVDVHDPVAVTKRLAEMRTAMYTAKGAETNMRKQLKHAADQHKEKEERWEAAHAELMNRLAQQQRDEKAKLEHVRTEAIFNNHAVYTTATKSRPSRAESSQRPPQRHDLRTPMPASPSRRGQEDARPLMSSSKGKGKEPAQAPPAQPAFRSLQNAFDGPPPTSNRKRTSRLAASSASPVKRAPSQGHTVKREPDDLVGDEDLAMGDGGFVPTATPARTPKKGASQGAGVFRDGMEADGVEVGDGQDEEGGDADMELEEVPKWDERAAFLSTLVSHNRPTALHIHHSKPLSHQTTLRRILAYQAPTDKDASINLAYPHDKIVWNDATSALLATLGEGEVSAERLMARTAGHLEALNEWMLRRILVTRSITEADLCVLLDVIRLMTALARLFPQFASEVVEHNAHDRSKSGGSWGMLCLELYSNDQLQSQLRDIYAKKDESPSPDLEAEERAAQRLQMSSRGRANQEVLNKEDRKREEAQERADTADWCTREFGCAVADLGEALCLYATGDEVSEGLIDIILCLTERQQHPTVIRRACEMFRAAATFSSHFRVLTMERPDTVSLINRLATYLAFKQRRGNAEELLSADIAIIRGLCMLTVADPSAIAIISERSCIVPSLIQVLDHEVRKVWGVNVSGESVVHAVLLMYPALMLLHMFVLPPPFVRSYATFAAGYNQPVYPRLSETVYPDGRSSDKPLAIRQAITVQRDLTEVKAERLAFVAAQEPIMSALPDAEIPRTRTPGLGLGGASRSIAFANGSDVPQALRLKQKLGDWSRQPEMRHVRHLLVAALAPTAYDELYEEMLVPELDEVEEVARMRKRGTGPREVFDMLRFSQILAGNILEVVYQEPTEVDGLWALYNLEQDEMERMAATNLLDEQDREGDDAAAQEAGVERNQRGQELDAAAGREEGPRRCI